MTRAEPVPLGGVDVFQVMCDRAMRAAGLPGNHGAYIVELRGRIDPRQLEARLERAVRAAFELSWRLERRLASGPRWRAAGEARRAPPPVRVLEARAGLDGILARATELLADRVDGDAPWAFDVVRGADRDAVVLRWSPVLTDGKGADRLVSWIGSGSEAGPEPPPPASERFASSERPLAALDREARLALSRAYNERLLHLGRTPILSPAGAHRVPNATYAVRPRTRALRVALGLDETRAFDARVRSAARLAETSVMVIAALRALDRLLVARGFAPPQYAVPVPVSLDPKGGCARFFGNHLTMVTLALRREELVDDACAIARLAEQQRDAVRRRLDLGMLAALSFARALPMPIYLALLRRPFAGEVASIVVSNPGAPSIATFAGLEVADAYPLPAVLLPPGLQVVLTRYGGRLSAQIVYVDPAVSVPEARRFAGVLRAELLGERPPERREPEAAAAV